MRKRCTFHRLPTQEEIANRKKAREIVIQHTADIRGIPIDQVSDDTEIPERALRAINEELDLCIAGNHTLTVREIVQILSRAV